MIRYLSNPEWMICRAAVPFFGKTLEEEGGFVFIFAERNFKFNTHETNHNNVAFFAFNSSLVIVTKYRKPKL